MKILLLLLLIFTIQTNCRLLLDCEDRSWYCKDRSRAASCQKMDECFPPTTPDDSVQKIPCTPVPYIDFEDIFLFNYHGVAKRQVFFPSLPLTKENHEEE